MVGGFVVCVNRDLTDLRMPGCENLKYVRFYTWGTIA
jgi:hypothetical protein